MRNAVEITRIAGRVDGLQILRRKVIIDEMAVNPKYYEKMSELLDELMKDCDGSFDLLGPDGLLKQLKAALVERALQEEMTDHLGHEKGAPDGRRGSNLRNGSSSKTLKSDLKMGITTQPLRLIN